MFMHTSSPSCTRLDLNARIFKSIVTVTLPADLRLYAGR